MRPRRGRRLLRTLARLLPRRTVRLRLTAVYVALFLASGAGLLTITYLLVDNHSKLPTVISIRGTTPRPGTAQLPSVGAPAGSGPPAGQAAGEVCVATGNSAPSTQQFGQCAAYFRSQEPAQRP